MLAFLYLCTGVVKIDKIAGILLCQVLFLNLPELENNQSCEQDKFRIHHAISVTRNNQCPSKKNTSLLDIPCSLLDIQKRNKNRTIFRLLYDTIFITPPVHPSNRHFSISSKKSFVSLRLKK
jgi:hypothetical protein